MIATLYARLETGWQLIDAEPDPRQRRRLEDHWLDLLHEYERACEQDASHSAPHVIQREAALWS